MHKFGVGIAGTGIWLDVSKYFVEEKFGVTRRSSCNPIYRSLSFSCPPPQHTHTHHTYTHSASMGTIYAENSDEDGFLYVAYSGENTFGH